MPMTICPLSGQACNQPKNIHVTEMVDGQYNEMKLCQQCAGMFLQPGVPIAPNQNDLSPMELLTNPKLILAAIFQKVHETRHAANEARCRACGISISEIAHNNKLGCPECYNFFPQLIQVIKVSQDGHVK